MQLLLHGRSFFYHEEMEQGLFILPAVPLCM